MELTRQREQRPFDSVDDLKARTRLNREELRTLAEVGALNGLAAHRRDALWRVECVQQSLAFTDAPLLPLSTDSPSPLAPMNTIERLQSDYSGMRLTTGPHPMALLRPKLDGIWRAADLTKARHGQVVRVAGSVICRQRPGTAKGFVFISLEDETGISNAIVTPQLFEDLRLVITQESFLIIEGYLQHADDVISIKARHIEALPHESLLTAPSYDFK
jgi:error-prone DNA polymerase